MYKIIISEDQLMNIINNYCSCGGRGLNDNPCDACAIWHELLEFKIEAEGGPCSECGEYVGPGERYCVKYGLYNIRAINSFQTAEPLLRAYKDGASSGTENGDDKTEISKQSPEQSYQAILPHGAIVCPHCGVAHSGLLASISCDECGKPFWPLHDIKRQLNYQLKKRKSNEDIRIFP